jgi:hypothetical protein
MPTVIFVPVVRFDVSPSDKKDITFASPPKKMTLMRAYASKRYVKISIRRVGEHLASGASAQPGQAPSLLAKATGDLEPRGHGGSGFCHDLLNAMAKVRIISLEVDR